MKAASETELTLTPKPKPSPKTVQVNPNFNPASFNPQLHHVHPGFIQIPNQILPLDQRYDTISYSAPMGPNFNLQRQPSPNKLPYVENPQQNNPNQNSFILDQNGKRYQVDQTLFQRSQPHLNTAIGAISAHILSQNNNQEYVPFPPNGNPSDYPAYHGHNYPTESPLISVYERANRAGYGLFGTGNIEKSDPREYYPNFEQYNDYPNYYDHFGFDYYSNPLPFGQFGLYPNVQTNNGNRNNQDPEFVSADRRSQVNNERRNEPIKRHS